MTRARDIAFEVLYRWETEGAFVNLALRQALSRHHLDERDRALCAELVYGCVQRRRSLDALLSEVCHRPLGDLDLGVLTILRMAVFQLAFLAKIPPYAALNEAVRLCKQRAPQAAGFVNAALRAYLRRPEPAGERLRRLAERAPSWADAMGLVHSYPTWLVERWERCFGRSRTVAMLQACNEPGHLSLRVNVLRSDRQRVLEAIQSRCGPDAAVPSVLSPVGIRLLRGIDVSHWDLYRRGEVSVQDEGAMLVAPLLLPASHRVLLDMCAAPGGKAAHLAELQGDTGVIDACDVHPHKLELMIKAFRRLGLHSIRAKVADARRLVDDPANLGRYHAVLLDAPCSGFGVLRRRPDIRWRRHPGEIEQLGQLQAQLLAAAVHLVRPGGIVVYSTCTLWPEENDERIRELLDACAGLVRVDDIRAQLPDALRDDAGAGGLWLTPERFGTDGFFMVRLRKAG
ncbi:MAG: 16S rRNA (cytosine(967)-C(5))-methyltransferase RsmB [Alicyclobacillaceae bacterium]|nr:16S rRNA (cytosine(967)-C(5))-methyltransferase RsmB [Alicyclobacillaceae bacterium]